MKNLEAFEERIESKTWNTETKCCLVQDEMYGQQVARQCENSEHCGAGWYGKG